MFKIRLCLCLVLVWFWARGHKSKTITLLLCLTLSLYIPFLKVRMRSKQSSSNLYGPGARRPWTLCQSWEFRNNMYVSKIRNAFLWCMLIMIIEHTIYCRISNHWWYDQIAIDQSQLVGEFWPAFWTAQLEVWLFLLLRYLYKQN